MGFVCPESAPDAGLIQDLELGRPAGDRTRDELVASLSPEVRMDAEDPAAMASYLKNTVPVKPVFESSQSQEAQEE